MTALTRAYSVIEVKALDEKRRQFSGWATTPAKGAGYLHPNDADRKDKITSALERMIAQTVLLDVARHA